MCTVSVVPLEDGVRVVCNRDEARARARALAPREVMAGRQRALYPVDPVSGGTWIGINESGIALALLNRSRHTPAATESTRSRGSIIPPLLAPDRIDAVVDKALSLEAAEFAPFRLVIIQRHIAGVVASDGTVLRAHYTSLRAPLLWTSSSLGDAVVERPRADLFDHLVINARDGWARGQRRFHRHRWTRHPELSVVMNRTQARTVSRTTIDLIRGRSSLTYEPLEEQPSILEYCLAGAA